MRKRTIFIVSPFLLMGLLIFASSCTKDDDNDNGGNTSGYTDQRDGHVYQTVIIGNQEWMAENLTYVPTNGNYCPYGNETGNVNTYGYLYDWQTALSVCPTGWHLPSDAEWTELTDYLGGINFAGDKLKEAGTTHWKSPNTGATNETSFTALPGGYRNNAGTFSTIRRFGYWWSATEKSTGSAWYRGMFYDDRYVDKHYTGKEWGFSVRCLKD